MPTTSGVAGPRAAMRQLLDHCDRGPWVLLLLGELAFLATLHAQDLARQLDPPISASAWAVTVGASAGVAALELIAALLGAHLAGRFLGGAARLRETVVAFACGGIPVVLGLAVGVVLGLLDSLVPIAQLGIEFSALIASAVLAADRIAAAQRVAWAGGACAVIVAAALAFAVWIFVYPTVYSWFPVIATGPAFRP